MKTVRQQMISLLASKSCSIREISKELGISEKEVIDHLPHIAHSISVHAQTLVINASACLSCGYEFKKRKRYTRPSRCPSCKSSHILSPTFYIKQGA